MACSNVWIPPFNDLGEREFRFVLGSGNVSDFNFELLHDLLYCFDNIPDVIAVTETRINCNSSANIDLPNYKFYSTDSKTMAGGVGINISSSLNAIQFRSDLSFYSAEAESCWIEILQEHKPSIIVGCIYRHPSSNLDNFFISARKPRQSLILIQASCLHPWGHAWILTF